VLEVPSAPRDGEGGDECTAIYFNGVHGPIIGQTWDMHGSAAPFVRMIRVRPDGAESEAVCFTLTGCLGMAGLGHTGVAVTINNLNSTDGRVGLVWPALVRKLLAADNATAARAVLEATPLSSGHYYVIADGESFFGIECSGELKVLTQTGARAAHLHTNHCFDPVLRKREKVEAGSTTFERLNMASTLYAQQRPSTMEELWELLSSHAGGRGAICHHADGPNDTQTCGHIVMSLATGKMLVGRGCGHAEPPRLVQLSRYDSG
jgi:isopenicillin-N N-acyltransferase-like protein